MTQPTFIYNLKSTPTGYAMAKLDEDYNIAAVYNLAPSRNGHFSCDCPANNRAVITKPCKHRRMLPLMLGAVNTDRFYEPESGTWHQPLGDLHREPPEGPEAQPEVTMIEGEMLKQVVGEAVPLSEVKLTPTEALSKLVGFDITNDGARPVGEALGSSAELVQGAERTATQVYEDARKANEPVQRVAEAMLEPIVNRVHELATKHALAQPAPTIRRRGC